MGNCFLVAVVCLGVVYLSDFLGVGGVERVTEHGLLSIGAVFGVRRGCVAIRYLVLDSGGFGGLTGRRLPSVWEVIRAYKSFGFSDDDLLIQLDYPPLPSMPRLMRFSRIRETLRAYRVMRSVLNGKVLPVLHGWSTDELELMASELEGVRRGCVASYFVTSVLHKVRRSEVVRRLRDAIKVGSRCFMWVLVLGGGGPNAMHLAFYLGANAIDGTAWRTAAARRELIIPGLGVRALSRSKRPKLKESDLNVIKEYWRDCGRYVNPLEHLSIREFIQLSKSRVGFKTLALWNAYAMKCEECIANEFRNDPDRYMRYLLRRWEGTEWYRYLSIVKSDYVQTKLTLYLRF